MIAKRYNRRRDFVKIRALIFAAAYASAQNLADEAARVLERARQQIINTTQRLPKYICLETIDRTYLDATNRPRPHAESCPAILGRNSPNLRTTATDRVRLDVTVSDGGELDSWPSASRFDTRTIDQIVTTGPTSTGAFGINLMQVFQNAGAKYQLTNVKTEDGRRTFTYTYQVALATSHYMVKLMDGSRTPTPYSGEFEIVAETGELTRLVIETGLLPFATGICRAQTTNSYHHVKVGEGDFILPVKSILRTVRPDGTATESVTAFSGCHEYGAESTIRFDADDEDPAPTGHAAPQAAEKSEAIPWGTEIRLRLESTIDTDTAAAGDIVWATVAQPVLKPKSTAVLLARGVRVRGRIIEAAHYLSEQRGWDIAIVFDRYQRGGSTFPFAAVLANGKARLPAGEAILRPIEAGGKLTIHSKDPKALVPQGFESKWLAVTPAAQ